RHVPPPRPARPAARRGRSGQQPGRRHGVIGQVVVLERERYGPAPARSLAQRDDCSRDRPVGRSGTTGDDLRRARPDRGRGGALRHLPTGGAAKVALFLPMISWGGGTPEGWSPSPSKLGEENRG